MPAGREIETQVRRIIADVLELGEQDISPEARFSDELGADSLHKVEIIMALENAFNLEIPEDDAKNLLCLRDAVAYVSRHSPIT